MICYIKLPILPTIIQFGVCYAVCVYISLYLKLQLSLVICLHIVVILSDNLFSFLFHRRDENLFVYLSAFIAFAFRLKFIFCLCNESNFFIILNVFRCFLYLP